MPIEGEDNSLTFSGWISMRSDLIFGAMKQVSNRFLLAKTVAQATRGFHKPGTRIQDTTNEVLIRVGGANSAARGIVVLIPATAPLRRSKQQQAIPDKPQSLAVPAMHEGQRALWTQVRE
jgi:hypothetical protein